MEGTGLGRGDERFSGHRSELSRCDASSDQFLKGLKRWRSEERRNSDWKYVRNRSAGIKPSDEGAIKPVMAE